MCLAVRTCSYLCLGIAGSKVVVNAHDLASAAHLWTQQGVSTRELAERQHDLLDSNMAGSGLLRVQKREDKGSGTDQQNLQLLKAQSEMTLAHSTVMLMLHRHIGRQHPQHCNMRPNVPRWHFNGVSCKATWAVTECPLTFVKLMSLSVLPLISSEAYLAMGWPTALATKGTVRDARGLASMM